MKQRKEEGCTSRDLKAWISPTDGEQCISGEGGGVGGNLNANVRLNTCNSNRITANLQQPVL